MKIFDGYNVIGAGKNLGLSLSREDKEEALLRLLYAYRSRRRSREKYLVVFDGDYGRLAQGPKKYTRLGIAVEWAIGESADSLIVGKVRRSRNPKEIEVISSDEEILGHVRRARARWMRSGDFLALVEEAMEEGAQMEKPDRPTAGEVQEWLTLFGGGESTD